MITRLALHLVCALRRPSHWRFHWEGAVREFRSSQAPEKRL